MIRRWLVPMLLLAACGETDPAGPEPPTSALRMRDVSAGYYHTCGLTTSGIAYCWGENVFGTLGDGTTTSHQVATLVADAPSFAQLDAGAGHNCALTNAGVVWCWGHNDEGQLGDGTFVARHRPVTVSGGITFASISSGHAHTCAVTTSGDGYCWGDDIRGQLGDGESQGLTKRNVPVRVRDVGEPWAVIEAGYYQSCGVTRGGAAYCWGAGESGQNGDGDTVDRDVPVRVRGDFRFSEIAPGDRFVCGVSDGETWCWGANRNGELGEDAASNEPVRLGAASSLEKLTTSIGPSTIPGAQPYACGVRADGRGYCWGGAVRALRADDLGVTELDARIRFDRITAGAQHICALSEDGYAYCGGANYGGQLGTGDRTDLTLLTAIPGPSRR